LRDPVAVAAPQIDNLAAIAIDRDGGTDLFPTTEVAPKRVGDLPITLVDISTH
jgi:hypothetical protein